ncbi:hypothetical protein AVEN_83099-1 [Araneus ventricosus]|uniref:Uncharacterized protein n=1 Tax=Araneus ventricosus TaxID=182803 RepID=A0A4Y2AMB8_ARAVE|nr:hypothetical protein AVEN_83099-1 [Araneus ventricosus]
MSVGSHGNRIRRGKGRFARRKNRRLCSLAGKAQQHQRNGKVYGMVGRVGPCSKQKSANFVLQEDKARIGGKKDIPMLLCARPALFLGKMVGNGSSWCLT